MSMNDERFDQLLWEMAHDEETPLPPGLDGRLEAIYARLEQEDRPLTKKEEKPVKRKIFTLARAAAFAAVVALMAVSVTVGALAFSTETIVEVEVPVPVEQETIVMEDIGITLILPDSWKDKYVTVVEGDRCAVYLKSIYDYCMEHEYYHEPETGMPVAGRLFGVSLVLDKPMTPEEFDNWKPWPAMFLMATETGTYALGLPSDVQWLPAMQQEFETMQSEIANIQLVLNGAMKGALNWNGYEK